MGTKILCWASAMSVVLVGCSGGVDQSETQNGTQESAGRVEGQLNVALLTPGPVTDNGWSAMAFNALQEIESEFDARIENQQTTDAQIVDAARNYGNNDFNLVIGHGFEYNAPFVEIAGDFPNTIFVSSSGSETAPNAGALRFKLGDAFYLAGMMAGMMSETKVVAMIGGPDVPSIRSTFVSFRAGAEDAGAEVLEIFTGSGDDIARAKQSTLAAIDEGADFVIHQANAGAPGVFSAAAERGIHALGANLNQNDDESGAVVASSVIVAGPAFLDLARQVQAGEFEGSIQRVGMAEGAIDFVIRDDFDVPAEVREALEARRAEIVDGSFEVPELDF